MSSSSILRRIVADGMLPVLCDARFRIGGRRMTWVRPEVEVRHVVSVMRRRAWHDIQWAVVSPEAHYILWGANHDPDDVAYGVVSGTPNSIQRPASYSSFKVPEDINDPSIDDLVIGVQADMRLVEQHLQKFRTRRDVYIHLMQNRDPVDRRDFVIPANLPLKLFTAATLATIDRDPTAHRLAADAIRAMAPFGGVSDARVRRLTEAVAALES